MDSFSARTRFNVEAPEVCSRACFKERLGNRLNYVADFAICQPYFVAESLSHVKCRQNRMQPD